MNFCLSATDERIELPTHGLSSDCAARLASGLSTTISAKARRLYIDDFHSFDSAAWHFADEHLSFAGRLLFSLRLHDVEGH